jgi:PAS domain S-box-containing protein
MATDQHQNEEHEQILKEMLQQFQPVFDKSPFGVYLYLDDVHKVCNEKMARMFGFDKSQEWAATDSFLAKFVSEEDQETFSRHYQHHIVGLAHPLTFRFHGKRKDGSVFLAETDMIPISWRGYPIAYHFVHEVM